MLKQKRFSVCFKAVDRCCTYVFSAETSAGCGIARCACVHAQLGACRREVAACGAGQQGHTEGSEMGTKTVIRRGGRKACQISLGLVFRFFFPTNELRWYLLHTDTK